MLLAFTTEEEKEYKNDMVWRNTTGLTASWIDRQDVIATEGTASSDIRGAAFLREQVQVDSYRLVLAFSRAAKL